MTTQLESSIVRIRAANGRTIGAGFLVGDRRVLTCAHVVAGALGLPNDAPEVQKPGFSEKTRFLLDFPLVAPEQRLTARVVCWQPALPDGSGDVAGLELMDAPPAGASPVRLVKAEEPWGHPFRAFGFPAGFDNGVWASGRMLGREATGWLQIEDVKQTGYFVAPGFSGGPVWDETLDGVVGMTVAADRQPGVRVAFIIPTDRLVAVWPNLAQIYLDAQMDQLRARRYQADEARREMRERQRVVNLRPLDVTHTFKDRVREVQALCDHLTDSSVRLVSVVGRGGMGKTALVSRVLGDLEQGVLPALGEKGEEKELPIDGILYLSARSTGLGLERIYADVGRMLGEPAASKLDARWADRDMPLTAKIEYLLEAMRDGLYLILLDNLESVMAEDGDIEEGLCLFIECCLTQPGGVRLIVTSREQVRITAAALHTTRAIPLREGLPEDEAVALLRDLDPQGALGLRDAPEEDLRRAARLTRGIPRALEILAGILHEDPTASLSRLLADENIFGEQVVEQLVAAGYRRLAEAERRVIEALAVFDRPVEETSVAYLLHPWWPGLDVRARLHRLVRGYFVSVNRVTGRYSLHPLDRDYAYRQIPDVSDTESDSYNRRNLELRAADFYASIRKPESEWQTIDDLEPQLAEFEHRVRSEDYDGAYQVLEPIHFNCLYLWGHCARLVELRKGLLKRLTDPVFQATNVGHLGLAYHALGQSVQAIEFLEKAVVIAREIGNHQEVGAWLGHLGTTYRNSGQFEQAIKLLEEALVIACETGDRRREGVWLGDLGVAYYALGQVKRAIELLEKALTIARETSYRWREGVWLGVLGSSCQLTGQFKRAIKLYEEALVIASEIGDRPREGSGLGHMGRAYYALGQFGQAIEFLKQALASAREIDDFRHEVIWLNSLGNFHCTQMRQFERAIKLYEQALRICYKISYRLGESYQLLGLGKALIAIGELTKAQQRCVAALDLGVAETSYQAVLLLGIVLLCQGDQAASATFVDAAARCRAMLDKTAGLYKARYALAAALVGTAVCDPCWADTNQRAALLAPSLNEYRRALGITSAPGIVQDALRDLELIRAAGIEGLEPAFELLETALKTA